MLDSYTSSMCKDSWGRSSFAWCLIVINSKSDFKESITIGIPNLDGPSNTKETIHVEYESKPPRCPTCNIFRHKGESCPKKVVTTPVVNDNNDGFQKVPRANSVGSNGGGTRGEASSKTGPSKDTNKGAPIAKKVSLDVWQQENNVVDSGMIKMSNVSTPNPFAALGEDDGEEVKNIWDNYYIDRRVLWNNLVGQAGLMRNRPWILLGNFNAALNLEDHSYEGYKPNAAMHEFKECVQAMEVTDANYHSPCVLRILTVSKPKPNPFKFSNFLVYKEGFREIVKSGWSVNVEGFAMFQVVKRLKGMKSPFGKLLHDHGNLHDQFNKIRVELDKAQKAIDRDPFSSTLREEHAHYLLAFKEAQLDEERFLKQKAKVEWLKAGDSNTAYFHQIVKSKCGRKRIEMVSDASNTFYVGNQVPGAFVNHYNQFLGAKGATNPLDNHDLFIRVPDTAKADFMVRDVLNDEVKSVIFSMGDERALGLDGFTAAFFKKAWDVVGGDITFAIRDFFSNGKLLKELNHTTISLIPKVSTPAHINYYRPISCCNVLYKCISKIIDNHVKEGLGDIVSINQSAFVPGCRIFDNILLTQEVMRNYHRRRGPPKCAFKVDIQKAHDMVRNSDEFQYHHLCDQERIINLCFADDLFLFAHGHLSSVYVIMDALEEFKQVSGLVPSIPKSTTFFCNVPNAIKASILNSMPFAKGALPASIFILPTRIVHDLEQLMRGFLWCQGEMKNWKAKVAWDSVCMPKHEGGLDVCPLRDLLSNRDIARSCFSLDDLVPLLLDDMDDVILWRYRDGVLRPFLVACMWSKVRVLCGMDTISPYLIDVVAFIVPISKGKTVISILSRIVVAATSYYIWLERNRRLFKKKTSSPD
ncbi:sodium/hydrogen exchanger 6 [Tanacetum coccineum]